jgi:phenylalanyl-tRNA synthetase beta chain
MLISLNWLKKYVDLKGVDKEELIKLIGSRLVEVEEVINIKGKYDKIPIVKVVSCEPIPETHLHLTKIDDRSIIEGLERDQDGLVQVVCGAPNVHAGMLAVWLAPGATIPETWGTDSPIIMGSKKLRGVMSHGMLCGLDEIMPFDDHLSIVEVDPNIAKPGDLLSDIFDLDDTILDIENKSLTHRPDCFGIIGFAREISGILGKPFKTPEWMLKTDEEKSKKSPASDLEIEITDPALCPRYSAIILQNDQKLEYSNHISEDQFYLTFSGMRPIDFIVDWTNIMMLLSGQPLHAFDYDKLVKVGGLDTPKIIVRAARKGESLELLDGKTIEMDENDIVITSNDVPVALAGAMGGANTVIDKNTKRIIVESATFSLYHLRKTQMKHGIFSEAITRFTKGQPPALTEPVLREFAARVAPYYVPASGFFDAYPEKIENQPINFKIYDVNALLGTDITIDDAEKTLRNVGFDVWTEPKVGSTAIAPYWRTDIHIKEDIIEEIARLNGYDNTPITLPLRPALGAHKDNLLVLKTNIRNALSSFGANEILTYSFIHGSLLEKVGQDPDNSYKIVNSISPDLEYFRQQIVPSLLEKAQMNLKSGFENFTLFEMNQVFLKSEGETEEKVPKIFNNLALVTVADFYTAKNYLDNLAAALGFKFAYREVSPTSDEAYFEPKRSAAVYLDNVLIGALGEIKNSVRANLNLSETVAAFELSLEPLTVAKPIHAAPEISKYPSVSRDLTLKLSAETPFEKVETLLRETFASENILFEIAPLSIYQDKDKSTKNLSFRLKLTSLEKTLTGNEISGIIEKVTKKAKDELGAEVV